jgi:hypothetical protein
MCSSRVQYIRIQWFTVICLVVRPVERINSREKCVCGQIKYIHCWLVIIQQSQSLWYASLHTVYSFTISMYTLVEQEREERIEWCFISLMVTNQGFIYLWIDIKYYGLVYDKIRYYDVIWVPTTNTFHVAFNRNGITITAATEDRLLYSCKNSLVKIRGERNTSIDCSQHVVSSIHRLATSQRYILRCTDMV